MIFYLVIMKYMTRNDFPKRPSGTPPHTLSKVYDVPIGFVSHSFEPVPCLLPVTYPLRASSFSTCPGPLLLSALRSRISSLLRPFPSPPFVSMSFGLPIFRFYSGAHVSAILQSLFLSCLMIYPTIFNLRHFISSLSCFIHALSNSSSVLT